MTEVNAEPKEASKMDFFVSKSMIFVWVLHASLFYLFQKEVLYINFRKAYLGSCQTFTRSSRPEVFCKKGVITNFVKFTGKHVCKSLSFLTKLQACKVAGLIPATLLKKTLWHSCFPVNFAKFLRTPFLQNTNYPVKHL